MPSPDEFDTIVQAVTAGYPGPEPGQPRAHRVLWFAAGTGLWLAVAILLYVLGWLLLHG